MKLDIILTSMGSSEHVFNGNKCLALQFKEVVIKGGLDGCSGLRADVPGRPSLPARSAAPRWPYPVEALAPSG